MSQRQLFFRAVPQSFAIDNVLDFFPPDRGLGVSMPQSLAARFARIGTGDPIKPMQE